MPVHKRVFVRPEFGQALSYEALKPLLGVGARNRQRKRIHTAPTSTPARHTRHDCARDLVWCGGESLRHRATCGPRLPIVGVKIPRAAGWFAVRLNQHGMLAAHFAIEPLHAEFLPLGGPLRELASGCQKAAVLAQHERDVLLLQLRTRALQLVHHVLLAPFCGDDTRSAKLTRRSRQPRGIRFGAPIRDAVAGPFECVDEVAHGREHQHELLPMPWERCALGHRFQQHNHDIVPGVARDVGDGAGALPRRHEGKRDGALCSRSHADQRATIA